MDKESVLQELKDAEAIVQGHFVLSSGLHSDTYIQCARALMDATRAERLCAALAAKVKEAVSENIDVVVSPAMGGVVVGYEMGRQLSLPAIFCERVEGDFTLRRGFALKKGASVLIVEDVVTTGKSSKEAIACAESYGANVVAEACLIDRSGGEAALPVPLIALTQLDVQTYTEENLPKELATIPVEKPGSRWMK